MPADFTRSIDARGALVLLVVGVLFVVNAATWATADDGGSSTAASAWRSPDLSVAEHRLIERALHREQHARETAIEALRALPDDRRVVLVQAGLGHPDVRIRVLAVELLGGLPRENGLELEACIRTLVDLLAADYPASTSPLFSAARHALLRLGATAVDVVADCVAERDLGDDPSLLELPELLDRQLVIDMLDELPVMPDAPFRPSTRAFEAFAHALSTRTGGIATAIQRVESVLTEPALFADLLLRRVSFRDYQTLALLLLADLGRIAPLSDRTALRERLLERRAAGTNDLVRTVLPAWSFADTRDRSLALECALHRLGDTAILNGARDTVARRLAENQDASPSLAFIARANCAWVRAWTGECEQAVTDYAAALLLVEDDAVRTSVAHVDLATVWAEFARALARLPQDVALPVARFPHPPAGQAALGDASPTTCREATTTALQATVALGYRDIDWLAGCGDFDQYAGDPAITPLLDTPREPAESERQPWGE